MEDEGPPLWEFAHELALEYGDKAFAYCMDKVAEAKRERNEEKMEAWEELAKMIDPDQAQALDPQMLLPGLFAEAQFRYNNHLNDDISEQLFKGSEAR